MKYRALISALGLISAAIIPETKLLAQQTPVPSSGELIAYSCPFFDISTVPELRGRIEAVYERTISSNPQASPLAAFVALTSDELPKFYILTGNWSNLRASRREYRTVLGRPSPFDPVLMFHKALSERDSRAMREVASVGPPSVNEPFLAPVAELPELAALYAELFEGGEGLESSFDRLSRTAAARAARLARDVDDRQSVEQDGDRERLSLAWLNFHLARVSTQMPERGASAAALLTNAASLLSPPCQPRTLEYFRTIASGRSPCEGGDLADGVNVYLCSLPEVILREVVRD